MRLITKYETGGVTIPNWVLRHLKQLKDLEKTHIKMQGNTHMDMEVKLI